MKSIEEINVLIFEYLNNKDVYTVEKILDELIVQTTKDNFVGICEVMMKTVNFHEMDLVIYLEGLKHIHSLQFKEHIRTLSSNLKDQDAIEKIKEIERHL